MDLAAFGTKPALGSGQEFLALIRGVLQKNQSSQQPFFIVVIRFKNMEVFRKRRSQEALRNFFVELFLTVRQAVHKSQQVCYFQEGLGLIFDRVDPGYADVISKRLFLITQHVIRRGKYNDLVGRWTDIIYQFLTPNGSPLLVPIVGWAVYPRDGASPQELVTRAIYHASEQGR